MSLPFIEYYKRFGIRRIASLSAPLLFKFDSLPRNAIFHFVSPDKEVVDIDTSKPWYQPYTKKIDTFMVGEINEPIGRPIRKSTPVNTLTVNFFKNNRSKFRFLKRLDILPNDVNTLLVISYGYLNQVYQYPDTITSEWNRWANTQRTMWETVKTLCQLSSRQHFITIDLPKQPIGRGMLNMFMDKEGSALVRVFDTPEERFILDFWRWLTGFKIIPSTMDILSAEDLTKINLVFTSDSGLNCVLNLAYLQSWIKEEQNLTGFSTPTQVSRDQLSKLFINMTLFLASQRPEEEYTETDKAQLLAEQQAEDDEEGEVVDPLSPPLSAPVPGEDSENRSTKYEPPISKLKKASLLPVNGKPLPEIPPTDTLVAQLKKADEDLEALDKLNLKRIANKGIKINPTSHDVTEIAQVAPNEITFEEVSAEIHHDPEDHKVLIGQVDKMVDAGIITAREYKTVLGEIERAQLAKDPYGSDKLAVEVANVTSEDLKLDNVKTQMHVPATVTDASMAHSSLLSYDVDYINKNLRRHVVGMVQGLQRGGVVVRKHEIEPDDSVLGRAENHTLELKPLEGVTSRIHFRIPKIEPDGTFMANGSIYTMRKQRVDVPILKISPTTVALSSYYGKNFVEVNERVASNSLEWIAKQVNAAAMGSHETIVQVDPADVFDEKFNAPYIYNALASRFNGIRTTAVELSFNQLKREEILGPDVVKNVEKQGRRLVGKTTKGEPVVVDTNNQFFAIGKDEVQLGSIYDVLGLEEANAPVDYVEMRVFSKTLPVGIILGYLIGLNKLIKLLKANVWVIEAKRATIATDEYALKFSDRIYVFKKSDRMASLILSGFLQFDKQLRTHSSADFDNKDIYFNLLDSKGYGSIYLREIDLSDQMFVDPITRTVLQEMGEPTTFKGLLIRATEMLLSYHQVKNEKVDDLRVRGYERVAGIIYKEMTRAIRQFNNKNISGRSKIDISPWEIWSAVMKDPAIKIKENINPVQDIKEIEAATFVGEGGRSKDSLNKASRAFRLEDQGVVSEATVDSSDVGINVYLSANPNLNNMLGLVPRERNIKPATVFSTAALLAPGAANDDGKRTNFISIQQSHTVASPAYTPAIIRTGMESVMANRTSPMFAYNAKQDGKVISVDETGMVIEYADGTKQGLPLGRQFGKAEGSMYPHDLVSSVQAGKKFKKGDNITYNSGFFEPDRMNPGHVVLKNSRYVTVALFESNSTFEDSSSISARMGAMMVTHTTKMKSITVDFTQGIHDIVKANQLISPKDVLMIIEDEITAGSGGALDEESIQTLRNIARQAPRSKYKGTVDRIEVFYHGDKADMSPTLRAIADRSDREIAQQCRHAGKPVVTGRTPDDYRVSGTPLLLDRAEIRIYITVETPTGTGDKGVFGNQLKSVVGEVRNYKVTTESGVEVDAYYNYRGVSARIVESAMLIGTTAALLRTISKNAPKLYRGEKL